MNHVLENMKKILKFERRKEKMKKVAAKTTKVTKAAPKKVVAKKPVVATRKNKDGATITIEKVEGKKQYIITVNDSKIVLNNTQAKAVLKDLTKILDAE